MNGNNLRATVLCIMIITGFAGCSGKDPEPPTAIELPSTPILSSRAEWGVTQPPYLRIRASASSEAPVTAHLRKGSVVEILDRSDEKSVVQNHEDYWYQVVHRDISGWVFGSNLTLYESREMAMNAAGESP